MTLQRLLAVLFALVAGAWCLQARADTTCTASAPPPLLFGSITSGGAAPTDTNTAITIRCTTAALSLLATASVRMCIGLGTGSTGTTLLPTRTMTNAAGPPLTTGDTLAYQLYSNSSFSTVYGLVPGGSPGAAVIDLTYEVPLLGGNGTATATVYARIPAGQTLSAGAFSSTYAGPNLTLQYAYNERLLLAAPTPAACNSASGVTGQKTSTVDFPFTVSATVLPQCSTYVTTDMDFGSNAGAVTTNIDRLSTIQLTCINRTAYSVGLNNGQNVQGTTRRMRLTPVGSSTSYYIPYELYRDPQRTLRWGNTLNVDTVTGTGNGAAQTLTVYGRTPPTTGAIPAQGAYSDVVTVTITY